MTLVFRRGGMALRPVHRIKHVVDLQFGIVAGATLGQELIKAVDAPVLANTTEVETGSKVNGIYLKLEINRTGTSSGVLPNFYLAVMKNPGFNIADVSPNSIGSDDNKRYVIHQEMVMTSGQDNSNPRTVFNGVIVIPRGYRRFGPNDQLRLIVESPGVAMNVCFQCHYKEFR